MSLRKRNDSHDPAAQTALDRWTREPAGLSPITGLSGWKTLRWFLALNLAWTGTAAIVSPFQNSNRSPNPTRVAAAPSLVRFVPTVTTFPASNGRRTFVTNVSEAALANR
jgi:hypothetical protein